MDEPEPRKANRSSAGIAYRLNPTATIRRCARWWTQFRAVRSQWPRVAFWSAAFWQYVGAGIFSIALIGGMPSYRRALFTLLRSRNAYALVSFTLGSEALNLLANLEPLGCGGSGATGFAQVVSRYVPVTRLIAPMSTAGVVVVTADWARTFPDGKQVGPADANDVDPGILQGTQQSAVAWFEEV